MEEEEKQDIYFDSEEGEEGHLESEYQQSEKDRLISHQETIQLDDANPLKMEIDLEKDTIPHPPPPLPPQTFDKHPPSSLSEKKPHPLKTRITKPKNKPPRKQVMILDNQYEEEEEEDSNILMVQDFPEINYALPEVLSFNELSNSIKQDLSIELFGLIASKLNESVFETKIHISIEDVMRYCAFLLSTGLQKMETIYDYFEATPFLTNKLIPKNLFAFLSATLFDNSILAKFPAIFTKPLSDLALPSERQFIYSNSLSLFDDYNFDFHKKNISSNYDQPEEDSDMPKIKLENEQESSPRMQQQNPEINGSPISQSSQYKGIFPPNPKGVFKPSLKLFADSLFQQNPIFYDSSSNLTPSPATTLAGLFEKASRTERKRPLINPEQPETKLIFLYHANTLCLYDIQIGTLSPPSLLQPPNQDISPKNLKIKRKKNDFTEEALIQFDSANPEIEELKTLLFQRYKTNHTDLSFLQYVFYELLSKSSLKEKQDLLKYP